MNQFNRRKFLKYSSLATGALSMTMTPSQLLAQNLQKLDDALPYTSKETHLLNRISFGINQESMNHLLQIGHEAYIDEQLDAENIDDSQIEDIIAQYLTTVAMSTSEIVSLIENEMIGQFDAAIELKVATFLRAVYSKRQLYQVMVEFWNNHFSVFHFDGPVSILKTVEDREMIRPLAFSTFSELLHANAKSPAMIYYLDNFSSGKDSPNENYARELLELHTLGVDGPYSHHDIDEVARCFTGWSIQQGTGNFRFYPSLHDYNEKNVLGHTINAGGGQSDGEQVLDILANHDSCAAFISKKLCQHFVSDTPDRGIVETTTEVFKSSDGDIKQCLRHILLSKHFLLSQDHKLKRPFHFITASTRTLNANILNGDSLGIAFNLLDAMGQQPFNWQTPDGYPDYASHWESTTGMLYRWNFINGLSFNQLPGFNYPVHQVISQPHTPENVYIQILDKVIYRNMNSTDEINLMQYLIDGAINNQVPVTKIQGALAIALGSPYFQLS